MNPALLVARARIRDAVRGQLARWGYVELDAPLLVRGTCPDPSLRSFGVGDDYLTTSTEYAIKRALAAGLPAAFTLTANFRVGEVSPTHNPEFTMLEWGRVGATLDQICDEANELVVASGVREVERGGRSLRLDGVWPKLRVADVVGGLSAAELLASAARRGVAVPPGWEDPATVLSLLLDDAQPSLGADGPVWLVDWPAWMTSSTDVEGTFARAELFCAGLELADGFPFLTGSAAGRAATQRALARREAVGEPPVRLDERYLDALEVLPSGAGMAMGFDRLVMLLTGAPHIRDVLVMAWGDR